MSKHVYAMTDSVSLNNVFEEDEDADFLYIIIPGLIKRSVRRRNQKKRMAECLQPCEKKTKRGGQPDRKRWEQRKAGALMLKMPELS